MAVAVGTIVDGPVKDGSSDSVRTVLSPGGIIKESGGSSVLIRLEHSWRWELGVSGVVGLCWSCAGLMLVLDGLRRHTSNPPTVATLSLTFLR